MDVIKITALIDNKKCFEVIRDMRWSNGIQCPHCDSLSIKKNGHYIVQKDSQHYQCKACKRYFDDLTNTVFSGHHQPLKVWNTCLYFMGLNLSNNQIAKELGLQQSDVHEMTQLLRKGVVNKKPEVRLKGEVAYYLELGMKLVLLRVIKVNQKK